MIMFPKEQLYAVGLFAFLGVWIRVLIYNAFMNQSDNSAIENYGPFIQIFYTQLYLLPNLMGTFLMGFFFTYKDLINQRSDGLYTGLTTGFCGSLTTFSSWMYTAFQLSFTNDNWYKILIMIFLESLLTWSALILGLSAGKSLQQYFPIFLYQAVEVVEPSPSPAIVNQDNTDLEAVDKQLVDQNTDENSQQVVDAHDIGTIELHSIDHVDVEEQKVTSNPQDEKKAAAVSNQSAKWNAEWIFWCIIFWSVAISLWATLLALPSLSFFDHTIRRDTFRAVCLAPLGAWLRWGLSKIPVIIQTLPTLKLHTLTANTVAVLFTSLLSLYSRSSWTLAVDYGVNGSCSTVSTFFLELYELNEKVGVFFAVRYGFVSIAVAMIIVQLAVSTT